MTQDKNDNSSPPAALVEGQKRFDVSVRLAASARDAVNHIADLWVDAPTGQRVPLASLASIKLEEGASRIGRDHDSRRIAVKCGVRGRDMGSFVDECQRRVAAEVPLPTGYRLTWERLCTICGWIASIPSPEGKVPVRLDDVQP